MKIKNFGDFIFTQYAKLLYIKKLFLFVCFLSGKMKRSYSFFLRFATSGFTNDWTSDVEVTVGITGQVEGTGRELKLNTVQR